MASKQQWAVGSTVKVGGLELFVQGTAEPTKPGEPRGYLVETLDRSKAYVWRPFRGLKLIRGELVRPNRKRKPRAARQVERRAAPVQAPAAPPPALVPTGGLWSRLKARFGLRPVADSAVPVNPPKLRLASRSQEAPGAAISGHQGH